MSSTNFVNGSTLSDAGWANDVDKAVYNRLTSVSGTNTIVGTGPVSMTAYAVGQYSTFVPAATNTGPATMNITPSGASALGARDIFSNGVALGGGELKINVPVVLWDDGTRFHIISSGASALVGAIPNEKDLTAYLLPSDADKWRGIYRAGFDHAFRNQQWGGPWGGEMLDAATGTLYRTEFATGYIETSSFAPQSDAAGETWGFTGFKVPETQTVSAVWLKLYKTGNPTGNLQLYILPDDGTGTKPTGTTPITNGTATAQSGKLHTSDANGAWYRFVFPTPPSCTGGTQYHAVVKSSAAVDASNYWNLGRKTSKTYPFGNYGFGDATPTWTASSTNCLNFLVELSATAQISQSSGIFDGKLAFGGSGASGTLSMSRGLCSSVPLHELIDLNEFTLRVVGNAFTKDATILDIGYGQDHDRIVLRSAVTTGYATLTVYESDGTVHTVTGSTDVSSGNQDIAIHVRAKADGSDEVELYVNGASQGTPVSSATITFDANFRNLGTMWIGGGFALAPTYSGSSIGINGFSGLPSTLGWTWTGTGTEANCMSVSGGKLLQNKNGYASTDTGYYSKAWAAANANGFDTAFKFKLGSNTNAQAFGAIFATRDDVKNTNLALQEYFLYSSINWAGSVQGGNWKGADNALKVVAKGSDMLIFNNGRLIVDATGKVTDTGGSNSLVFGDASATAGENADVVYSYMKYYTTDWNPPQFTSGSISELAIWSGDRTSILASLYNAGTLVSVKQYCGLPRNYLDKSGKLPVVELKGITSDPTTTTTGVPSVQANEMECFAATEFAEVEFSGRATNSADQSLVSVIPAIDGVPASTAGMGTHSSVAGGSVTLSTRTSKQLYLGLHKFGVLWSVGSNTGTLYGTTRNMEVRPKV